MPTNLLSEFDDFYTGQPELEANQWIKGQSNKSRTDPSETASLKTSWDPWAVVEDSNPWLSQSSAPLPSHRQLDQRTASDDDWGSFESSQKVDATHQLQLDNGSLNSPALNQPSKPAAAFEPWGGFDDFGISSRLSKGPPPEPVAAQAHLLEEPRHVDAVSSTYFPRPSPVWEPEAPKLERRSSRPARTTPRDENVLFDAEDASDEADGEDDEDFGDFEAGEVETEMKPAPHQVEHHYAQQFSSSENGLINLMDEPSVSISDTKPFAPLNVQSKDSAITPASKTSDPFGDLDQAFGALSTSPAVPNPAIKLAHQANDSAQATKMISNGRSGHTVTTSTGPTPRYGSPLFSFKQVAQEPANDSYDAWGDWDDDTSAQKANSSNTSSSRAILRLPQLLRETPTETASAPSNVPPPAVLLPLFAPLINVVHSELLRPLNKVSQEDKEAILSDVTLLNFVRAILTIATVLGHIIAGRKLRWKRDTILSQSMRIGQAGTKSSGMKLASIDKTEDAREEQEISQVVRLWRLHAGKIRTTIASAGILDPFPEIAEALPVRTAQISEGAIAAAKQCALCGLKRNERVPKVDSNVDDTFGEWWVEHWGHKTCKTFWDSEEQTLRSR